MALLHGAAPRRLSGTAVAGFARRTSPRNRAPRLVLNAPWVGTLFSEASDSARKQAVMQHIVFCLSSESHRSKKTLSRLLGTKFRDLRSMLHIAAIPLPLPPALRGSCGESLPWPDQLSSCRALINFMCGNCGGNVSCGPQTTEVATALQYVDHLSSSCTKPCADQAALSLDTVVDTWRMTHEEEHN